MVNGIREAFQPGTEPHVDTSVTVDQLLTPSDETPPPPGAPGRPGAPVVAAPPPRPVDDMKGLF
jgi:hypothetical protein